jgi:hypothetical protein
MHFLFGGEAEIFAFDVPSSQEFSDIGVVEEGCAWLSRARHDAERTVRRCRMPGIEIIRW